MHGRDEDGFAVFQDREGAPGVARDRRGAEPTEIPRPQVTSDTVGERRVDPRQLGEQDGAARVFGRGQRGGQLAQPLVLNRRQCLPGFECTPRIG